MACSLCRNHYTEKTHLQKINDLPNDETSFVRILPNDLRLLCISLVIR